MAIEEQLFMKAVDSMVDNATNIEKLSGSIDNLNVKVGMIATKYESFSKKMVIVELEMGFLIVLTTGVLFTLIQMLSKL